MKLGLEVSAGLAPRFTGVQRYIYELIHALYALNGGQLQCTLLLRLRDRRKHQYMQSYPWPTRWYLPGPWPMTPRCDILHGLSAGIPYAPGAGKRVSTLHDLFALTLSDYGSRRTLRRYRRATRADRIIAVSHATKNDFLRFFDYPEERIDVVYHGVSEIFLSPFLETAQQTEHTAGRSYLLAFGGAKRKNLERTLRAFGLSSYRHQANLVVVGNTDVSLCRLAEQQGLTDRVLFKDAVDEPTMARLYRQSAGLVFPSLQEGFGLPILEAMACGVPVVTSRHGATAEIAGGHAVLVDPTSVDDIAKGIDAIGSVCAERLAGATAHAHAFTWQRTAQQTLAVYRTLL